MDHLIAIYSIFCIGMVYFRCLLVNPHVQAVQNMCGKGGKGISGRVTGGRSLLYFQKKIANIAVLQINTTPTIFGIELANINHFFP